LSKRENENPRNAGETLYRESFVPTLLGVHGANYTNI
jgi:hypothetical protein